MGFNFIEYLKRHLMLGQVDPWRKTLEDQPIYTLLVDINYALEECKRWSNQDIQRQEFVNYLKINDIYLFKNVDEFKNVKDKLTSEIKSTTKTKRSMSLEQKETLRNRMLKINNERKASTSKNPQ